jgi:hypothetical protein
MLRLNQSTIKDINRINCCPRKYKAYNIDELFKRPSTDAMLKGNYFEWMCLGTKTRNGKIPFMPKLKNGNKSTAQIRIDEQAKKFHVMLRETNTTIVKPNVTLEAEYTLPNGRTIILFGTLDILVTRNGEPGIIDLKFTANVESTFGHFCWGDIASMNVLQSNVYKYILKKLTGKCHFFEYWVYDCSPRVGNVVHDMATSWDDVSNMRDQIVQAVDKRDAFDRMGYIEIPDIDECKGCQVKGCASKITELIREDRVNKKIPMVTKKETILLDLSMKDGLERYF